MTANKSFSGFIRTASDDEKCAVYEQAMKKATEDQNKVLEEEWKNYPTKQKKVKKYKPKTMLLIDGKGGSMSYTVPYKTGMVDFTLFKRGVLLEHLYLQLDDGSKEIIHYSLERRTYHSSSYLTLEVTHGTD